MKFWSSGGTARGGLDDSSISNCEPHLLPYCVWQEVQLWQLLWAFAASTLWSEAAVRPPPLHGPFTALSTQTSSIYSFSRSAHFSHLFFWHFLSHSSHLFPPSVLSVCPIASLSLAAVCQWLHASRLPAQTAACVLPPSLLALPTVLTAPCLCVCIVSSVHHLSRHDSDSWIEPYNPEITRQLCCELIRSVFSVEKDSVSRSHTGIEARMRRYFLCWHQ